MNNPSMEDSIHIQRLKQKIWEKKHPKEIKAIEEQQAEQIDFEKYLKEEENESRRDV